MHHGGLDAGDALHRVVGAGGSESVAQGFGERLAAGADGVGLPQRGAVADPGDRSKIALGVVGVGSPGRRSPANLLRRLM